MRSEACLILLLALAGCSDPPPPPEATGPAKGDAAYVGTETEAFRPGSRRAAIYTWRDRFPLEVLGDVTWILHESFYTKTEDLANTWKVLYATGDSKEALQVAACEYTSPEAARTTFDEFRSKIESAPITVEGCDAAVTGHKDTEALAAAVSSRYLFIFDRPRAKDVGEPALKAIVKACFTEPPPDEVAPVASPGRNGG